MAQGQLYAHKSTLGLHWHCPSYMLSYKHHPFKHSATTMHTIYQVLASQYDTLGFIVPYTTRAKVMGKIERLGWPIAAWCSAPHLAGVGKWASSPTDQHTAEMLQQPRYGLCKRSKEDTYIWHLRKGLRLCVLSLDRGPGGWRARSCVAPEKKKKSIPHLELCTALSRVQLSKVLKEDSTLPIHRVTLWTDSTTALT